MDMVKKLPREVQVVLGAAVLYLVFSFLDWQQVSFLNVSAGVTEWHGIGVVAGLLVIALLVWEAVRLFQIEIPLGPLTPGLVSVGLALLLLLFTVITFLSHSSARHWPAWVGLVLSIVIAAAAVARAKAEGVKMPDVSAIKSAAGTQQSSGGTTAPPAGTTTPPAPPPGETSGPGPTTPGPTTPGS